MLISTFNIQNNYDTYHVEKTKILYKYIKDYNIDIIGLQEVFPLCSKDLTKLLKKEYYINGKYRYYSKLLLHKINEKNPLITKEYVLKHKTYHLPSFPSLFKRIITHIEVTYNNIKISIYNTHLEVKLPHVKERQLNKILSIIKKDKNPIIIMGDFNMTINNPILDKFINKLKELNIKRVPINEKTFKYMSSNLAIDHIFLSNNFTINKIAVIKDIAISDHYPVIANISLQGGKNEK